MLQVTAEMSVYNGLKGIRRYIYIHHFPFVIVEKMYRTNTVVQRQLPETGDGRITRFIQGEFNLARLDLNNESAKPRPMPPAWPS